MKNNWDHLEHGRITSGSYGTIRGDKFGGFFFKVSERRIARVIACDAEETGWEHVSVSCLDSKTKSEITPSWENMCFIKDLFWNPEECVIQFHPPVSEYVNNHPHCLHLWKPVGSVIPTPPSILVGIK